MSYQFDPAAAWESIIEIGPQKSFFGKQTEWKAIATLAVSELSELRAKTGSTKGPATFPSGVMPTQNTWRTYIAELGEETKELRAKTAAQAKTAPASSAPLRRYEGKTAPAVAAKAALVGSVTAEQFRASIAKPTMARSEWNKLSITEQNAWFRSGGKLID